jgi:hypothetical protein
MSQQNQPELPPRIYAEAVVRSVSGKSLLDSAHFVTSKNVSRLYAMVDRVEAASHRLHQAGFDILDIGKILLLLKVKPGTSTRLPLSKEPFPSSLILSLVAGDRVSAVLCSLPTIGF